MAYVRVTTKWIHLTILPDNSKKSGDQHAQGNLAAKFKCFKIISVKIHNNSLQDLKNTARHIRRAECAKRNDRVARRFMLMHTVGGST
jgi:hypothetical protein